MAVILLIAILAAVDNGGSGTTSNPYNYNNNNGAGLPTQYYSSTTTDPNSGYTPADEPQTQSTLATSDESGQTPTTGLSDTPTDSGLGTDAGTTDSGTPTDTSSPTASATDSGATATGAATTGTATGANAGTHADPASVVGAYFDAINNKDYQTAWNLGGKNLDGSSLAHFSAGFSQTQQDRVTFVGVQGAVVTVDLVSQQTDGTEKSYTGSYTVSDGAIISASVTQTS